MHALSRPMKSPAHYSGLGISLDIVAAAKVTTIVCVPIKARIGPNGYPDPRAAPQNKLPLVLKNEPRQPAMKRDHRKYDGSTENLMMPAIRQIPE